MGTSSRIDPKDLPDCDVCDNKRYLVCRRSDGFLAVQRCDTCSPDWLDDEDVVEFARADGIACRNEYPCYLTNQEEGEVWVKKDRSEHN